MDKYIINGGLPLNGTILAAGSKNVALKVMIASVLSRDQISLENIPNLSDLMVLEKIMQQFGSKIHRQG